MDASVAYFKLLQLHLSGNISGSYLWGCNLALCAVNLSEVGRSSVSNTVQAEIYIAAALHVMHSKLELFARYFLHCARYTMARSLDHVPANIQWICHPEGHNFFLSGKWRLEAKESIYTAIGSAGDPLAYVTQQFREHLLERGVYTLVTSGGRQTDRPSQSAEILLYTQLLTEAACLKPNDVSSHMMTIPELDECATWWSGIVSVAVYWLLGDDENAERCYSVIDSFPKKLQTSDDPLPKSVLMAFRARRNLMVGSVSSIYSVIRQADRAGRLLRESLKLSYSRENTTITQAVQLLVCDWLLATRTEAWEREEASGDRDSITQTELIAFQQDLASLRKLAQTNKAALPRVFLHEATARMMAGASPARTQQLLDRSIIRNRGTQEEKDLSEDSDSETPDREQATALLMAGRHLPESVLANPGDRLTLISEASRLYEVLGDKKSVQTCRKTLMLLENRTTVPQPTVQPIEC